MGEKQDGGEDKKAAEAGGPATVVLKADLHCGGCAKKVKRVVKGVEGVEDVKVDVGANKVVAIGKVDPAKLRERLEAKTQKKFELVSHSASPAPPAQPKEEGGGGGDGGEKKAESKKAYWNYAPTYGAGPPAYGAGPSYAVQPYQNHHMEPYHPGGGYPGQAYATPYPNDGYVVDHRAFSDENPNACSVM